MSVEKYYIATNFYRNVVIGIFFSEKAKYVILVASLILIMLHTKLILQLLYGLILIKFADFVRWEVQRGLYRFEKLKLFKFTQYLSYHKIGIWNPA